jgi:hypothetical protein
MVTRTVQSWYNSLEIEPGNVPLIPTGYPSETALSVSEAGHLFKRYLNIILLLGVLSAGF